MLTLAAWINIQVFVCLFFPLSVQILENAALWEQVFGTAAQDDR